MAANGMRIVLAGLLVWVVAAAAPAWACCDWTPQDRAFWDKMYENPQKFSYDMAARLTHFKIRAGGDEEVLSPESAQKDDLWRHVLHHLYGTPTAGHPHESSSAHKEVRH
jgi:hypothetical protein